MKKILLLTASTNIRTVKLLCINISYVFGDTIQLYQRPHYYFGFGCTSGIYETK